MNHPRRGMFVVSLDDEDLQKITGQNLVVDGGYSV